MSNQGAAWGQEREFNLVHTITLCRHTFVYVKYYDALWWQLMIRYHFNLIKQQQMAEVIKLADFTETQRTACSINNCEKPPWYTSKLK